MSDDEGGGSLYVLTAVLLTPAQFPSILGDDFPEACSLLGVEQAGDGYGLVLGQDEEGARWTVVVDDVSLVATAIASWDCGMEYDLSPDERSIVVSLVELAAGLVGGRIGDPGAARSGAGGGRHGTGASGAAVGRGVGSGAAADGRGPGRAGVGRLA